MERWQKISEETPIQKYANINIKCTQNSGQKITLEKKI